jgi:hypothetical protein
MSSSSGYRSFGLAQGWQSYLKARAKIVDNFRINFFRVPMGILSRKMAS